MAADEDLLVFGYSSRIYPPDDRSEFIAEERHLIELPNDPSLKIDRCVIRGGENAALVKMGAPNPPRIPFRLLGHRLYRDSCKNNNRYDVRLLLPVGCSASASIPTEQESCSSEDLEEEMCDEERYRDLGSVGNQTKEEEEQRPKKAEIGFDYGTEANNGNGVTVDTKSDDSDSEAEPFEPPPGVKLPLGLAVPDNQKQNHIIERTALFVVTKGPQMEIVIKAKQRNNSAQFGFLEFDNVLHPYYKYLSKLIREKKYIPNFAKGGKNGGEDNSAKTSSSSEKYGEKKPNALTALAQESDTDSDSDCELHPSLMSGYRKRERSPDLIDAAVNAAGPRRRPTSPSPPPISAHREDYDMSKSNDIYASLFKSLKKVSTEKEEAEKRVKEQQEIKKHIIESAPPPPDEEYRAWWLSFYGTPCPYSCPQPMVPPPPDLQPIIASYAEFVARNGAEAELELRDRVDLQLNFMHPTSHHFSYYQHLVRMCQWELSQKLLEEALVMEQAEVVETEVGGNGETENPTTSDGTGDVSTATASSEAPTEPGSAESATPVMNRKQRRRLQDAFRVPVAQPVGIVDPFASVSLTDVHGITKVSSSPALLTSVSQPCLQVDEVPTADANATAAAISVSQRPFAAVPVSFSLAPVKEENTGVIPNVAVIEGPDSPALVDPRTLSPVSVPQSQPPNVGLILPPPVPPNIPSNTQLDRKEKARIFMERLLNEKRVKKLKEQEEARIRELEAQKAEIERQLAEEESKKKKTSLEMVDKLINRRIGALLGTSAEPKKQEKEKAKLPARLSDDEMERDRDELRKKRKKEKSKKHKHKKSRSRSRSRDRSKDRERRRRRRSSDTPSGDRDSSRKRRKERR